MTLAARWVDNGAVPLARLQEGIEVVGNPQLARCWDPSLAGAYVPRLLAELAGVEVVSRPTAVRDDNRTALLPERRYRLGEREYLAAVKGCGAEFDPFRPRRISASVLREICHDPELKRQLGPLNGEATSFIVGERWWGYAPYGGQACDNALLALLASLRATSTEIAGFHICPLVAAVRLPDPIARVASRFYWLRRYDGSYWQEVRLMPSNVRLYFHSEVTLGVDTGHMIRLFELTDLERCERFLVELFRSTIAAITLYARSLRHDAANDRYVGLDFDEVYLDKDAVVAADGTLHFADLEGVEPFPAATPAQVRERIESQFYHNLYEATYATETMAIETERLYGLPASASNRRDWTLDLLEEAIRTDPYVRAERADRSLTLSIEPAVDPGSLNVDVEWSSGREG